MRTVTNKAGIVYDSSASTIVYAEDVLTIKTAIDDATTGVNTEQLEIKGVLIVNSAGSVLNGSGVRPQKDKKRGSNCSGSDGAINRTLQLSNTSTTTAAIVMTNGAFLAEDADFTITHSTTSSTITFLNNIFNTAYIEVVYFA